MQTADKAPAIVSVITAEKIRKSGARSLYEVLQRVPGFGVSMARYGKHMIEVRGIKTIHSEKIKMLIDGHSTNGVLDNSFTWGPDSLSLNNIKRIEIIRGPGSALHGSNAFVGIINIVTNEAEDIDGVIITAGSGNFDTKHVNVQAGKRFNNIDASYFIDVYDTNGSHRTVSPDVIGRTGNTDLKLRRLETGLKIKYKDFSWNTHFIDTQRGAYIGALSILGDENKFDNQDFFSELNYSHSINEDLVVSATGFIDKVSRGNYLELYPEGFTPFTGTSWFDDGMIANPSGKETILGAEVQLDYKTKENHLLTIGARAEKHELSDAKAVSNVHTLTGAPLDSVQETTHLGGWIDESKANRNIVALYLQDVWSVTETIDMTLGVRHDNYSDFGGTTNPRVAFVWQFLQDWDLKALYGTAFRAPTINELYIKNNAVVKGNENLNPETMKTAELSLGFNKENLQARATYFNITFENKILPDPIINENKGGADVQGVELEAELEIYDVARFYGNYTFQDAEDSETGKALPDVSRHKANIGADLSLGRYLNVNFNLFGSSSRPRAEGDGRPALKKYSLLDIAIIGKSFYPGVELRASVFNVLDENHVDPSLPDGIPNDHPRAGRSFMLDVTYRL